MFEVSFIQPSQRVKLPKSYREFLKGYFFVRVLKYCNWRKVKNASRPFCFASNKYVHFDDFGILKIDNVIPDRKHCQCGDKFIKIINTSNQITLERAQNEIQFLQKFGGQNSLPKLYATLQETDETVTRIFIIRDNIKGIPFSTKLSKAGKDFDSWKFVKQLLYWVIFLEQQGYYQTDLYPGNFIYTEDEEIIPIDYELITHKPISHRWPYNIRLTIFNIINAILEKKNFSEFRLNIKDNKKYYSKGHLLTTFSKYVSEDKYRRILALNDDEKFFDKLYEILFSSPNPRISRTHTIAEVEILEKEQFLQDLCSSAMSNEQLIVSLTKTVQQQQKRIEQLEKLIREKIK